MHELSLCQALLTQVETLARQHQAQKVSRIVVQVGPLGGVEPDLLSHAFTIARAETVAAEAELVLEMLPVRIRCQQCNTESEVEANHLCCRVCGDWHTQLLSGDELLLASVELIQ